MGADPVILQSPRRRTFRQHQVRTLTRCRCCSRFRLVVSVSNRAREDARLLRVRRDLASFRAVATEEKKATNREFLVNSRTPRGCIITLQMPR